MSSPRRLKGERTDLNPLIRTEPAGGTAFSSPAGTVSAAQVYTEDPSAELLQVGVTAADRCIFQAKRITFVATDQDEGLVEDAWLAAGQARA